MDYQVEFWKTALCISKKIRAHLGFEFVSWMNNVLTASRLGEVAQYIPDRGKWVDLKEKYII